jgi:DegV family protein with EDD domain
MKVVGEKEYVDTPELDLLGMVNDLKAFKGKSGSSCPNVQEWIDAFGDADEIYGVTISRNLSGSYNAALQAAEVFMEENPGKKVHIFDSFSAGPEQAMIIDKIAACVEEGCDFETVIAKVEEYQNNTHILFCLESLTNLARNGRVNPAVAKIAGVLGIRIIGDAQSGQIVPAHKVRGHKKAMQTIVEMMEELGFYDGALIRVAGCFAESQANDLKELVLAKWPNARFVIEHTTALCSFYAEAGGLMIGMEAGFNEGNNPSLFR